MAVVTTPQAVDLLTKQVERDLGFDELVEVHNELFPDMPFTPEKADGRFRVAKPIVDYLKRGLEPEELVEVWNLILPRHRNVWYDEEEDRIHYNEQPRPAPAE